MNRSRVLIAVAGLVFLGVPLTASAVRISCESRDYRRNYCPAGGTIASARLVVQQSRSACVQGRTWGYDSTGIWVTQGCSAEFDFKWSREPRPTPPDRQIACASQNYQEKFCPSDRRITRAWLVEQRSQSACVQGRSWGFQDTGIWVASGCNGVFGVEGRGPPPGPPPINRLVCASRGFQQAFCAVPSIARAWVIEQRSESPCIQGDTWGFQRNGVWVDRGCSALFAYEPR